MIIGICPIGQGFPKTNHTRSCSKCPLQYYNNDAGSVCYSCKPGYDTNGWMGAKECISKSVNVLLHMRAAQADQF